MMEKKFHPSDVMSIEQLPLKSIVMMYNKIILSAFAKAKTETPGCTKTQWADHLTTVLWCDFKYQISRRTLLNYYNAATKEVELIPKPKTIDLLCKYLHYPNYATFLMHQSGLSNTPSKKSQRITYTLNCDGYKEEVTIFIRRDFEESLNVA